MKYSEKQSKINSESIRRQKLVKDLKHVENGKINYLISDEVNFDLDDVSQLDEVEEKQHDSSSRKSFATNSQNEGKNKFYINLLN